MIPMKFNCKVLKKQYNVMAHYSNWMTKFKPSQVKERVRVDNVSLKDYSATTSQATVSI